MTEQVNWADAPDGAEAYLPHSKEQYFSWLKKDPVTGCTMIFVPGVLQAWTEMGGRRDYPYGHVLRPVTPPAAQVQGEQPEVVGHLLLCGHFSSEEMGDIDADWDMKVAERLQQELVTTTDDVVLPLMTVAQHQRIVAARNGENERLWSDRRRDAALISELRAELAACREIAEHNAQAFGEKLKQVELMRAALSAPPAAGVPEGLKADLYEIAGQILNIAHSTHKPVSHTLMAPIRDYTLKDAQSVARVAGERLVGIADRIAAAPTPPASEQQQAVVMPDSVRTLLSRARAQIEHLAECTENLGEDLDDDDVSEDVAEARALAGEIDELLRLYPHLQPAAPSQGE